jgi:phage terminase small subunit
MTRKSDSNNIIPLPGGAQRLRPPPHLTEAEKEAFIAVVGSVDKKYFQASDLPLVASYAVSIVQEQEAVRHLHAEGYVVNGKPSPWIVIAEKAHRSMVALSLRLRLSPQGRGRPKVKPDRLSYYEQMRLEENEDDND